MARRARWKVSFDLGSTYSSYAYCKEDDDGDEAAPILVGGPWKPFFGADYPKTLTALLYNERGAVEQYGFDPLRQMGPEKAKYYFQYFKARTQEEEVSSFSFKHM